MVSTWCDRCTIEGREAISFTIDFEAFMEYHIRCGREYIYIYTRIYIYICIYIMIICVLKNKVAKPFKESHRIG